MNPVVQGMSRAKAELARAADTDHSAGMMPVEIHGDAAMSGQGVVMETLSLCYARGHRTGGTVHVVANNQIGFTTPDPRDTRSSFFTTDVAKMIEAPVLHINGDDPEAVALAVRLAVDYRTTFRRSVVIDLVCFRKYGHQEQDMPAIRQPLMYRASVATGKVYFELLQHRRDAGIARTPIIRVERQYPFPAQQLAAELARFPNLKTGVWCREEAHNQGAWSFVEPRLREMLLSGARMPYAGPDASASTAPGYHSAHVARQAALVAQAFTG